MDILIFRSVRRDALLMLAGSRPGSEVLLFRQKDPKPLTPSLAKSNGNGRQTQDGQLVPLKQARKALERLSKSQPAGVEYNNG